MLALNNLSYVKTKKMATGGDGGETWWGGWIQAAKEKSAVAIQQMQKDLGEFTTTIQRDTSTAVASSATVIKDSLQTEEQPGSTCTSTTSKVKEGFSNLLSGISDSLAPRDYGREDSPPAPRKNKQAHIFDRAKARLHAIQTDPGTYCNEPDGPLDLYEKWQESFDLEAKKGQISDLLVANTDVRALFTKLVPAAVSHSEFWSRYFYKLHLLGKDEARRAALKERADMTSSQTLADEDLGWGDDEDETWDTMPDAKQAAESRQHPKKSNLETKPDQAQLPDDAPKSADQTRILETPSTTPDVQHISREKVVEDTRLEMKQDNVLGQSMDRITDECLDSKSDEKTISQELVTPNTQNLPRADHEVTNEESQSELPLDKADKTGDDVLSKEKMGEQGLVKELEELKVSTTDSGKDVKDNPSPVASESSSANKELSSLSDDWEKDFDDIEVTEEDVKAAAAVVASKPGSADEDLDDDWENWD